MLRKYCVFSSLYSIFANREDAFTRSDKYSSKFDISRSFIVSLQHKTESTR